MEVSLLTGVFDEIGVFLPEEDRPVEDALLLVVVAFLWKLEKRGVEGAAAVPLRDGEEDESEDDLSTDLLLAMAASRMSR